MQEPRTNHGVDAIRSPQNSRGEDKSVQIENVRREKHKSRTQKKAPKRLILKMVPVARLELAHP